MIRLYVNQTKQDTRILKAARYTDLIVPPTDKESILAKKLYTKLSKAMQYNYTMDAYTNYLSESYVTSATYKETQDLLDELSIAGYCICSRHSIDEILNADKVIIRVASVASTHAPYLARPELTKTVLFIIPGEQV